jgi:hypothetical protein
MTVTYFGNGGRVNSGGSDVSSIVVPRPASIAVGDYVILFGYANTWPTGCHRRRRNRLRQAV